VEEGADVTVCRGIGRMGVMCKMGQKRAKKTKISKKWKEISYICIYRWAL
jgi:hypothetical protein